MGIPLSPDGITWSCDLGALGLYADGAYLFLRKDCVDHVVQMYINFMGLGLRGVVFQRCKHMYMYRSLHYDFYHFPKPFSVTFLCLCRTESGAVCMERLSADERPYFIPSSNYLPQIPCSVFLLPIPKGICLRICCKNTHSFARCGLLETMLKWKRTVKCHWFRSPPTPWPQQVLSKLHRFQKKEEKIVFSIICLKWGCFEVVKLCDFCPPTKMCSQFRLLLNLQMLPSLLTALFATCRLCLWKILNRK